MKRLPFIEDELTEISQHEIRLRKQIENLRELRRGHILKLHENNYTVPEIVRLCNIGGNSITRQAVHLIVGGNKYQPE